MRYVFLQTSLLLLILGTLLCVPSGWAKDNTIRLDDFSKSYSKNTFPPGWRLTKVAPFFGNGQRMEAEFIHTREQHFLRMASGANNSFSIGREKDFLLPEHPILEWEWKVSKTPKGGDVRINDKDDQAGSICVVVNPGLVGFDSLCYVWENKGPKGAELTSTKRADSKYIILRTSEQDALGTWYKERRPIYEDYKRLFGKEPDEKAVIGMFIDSNDTKTSAEAFYRRILLHKR